MGFEPSDLLTVGQVADHFHVQSWRVVRLFERGLLPEPPRVAGSRIIHRSELPRLERALREAEYLK